MDFLAGICCIPGLLSGEPLVLHAIQKNATISRLSWQKLALVGLANKKSFVWYCLLHFAVVIGVFLYTLCM